MNIPAVTDRGRRANAAAATQTERCFGLVELGPFRTTPTLASTPGSLTWSASKSRCGCSAPSLARLPPVTCPYSIGVPAADSTPDGR
jgi:hypothetical protein